MVHDQVLGAGLETQLQPEIPTAGVYWVQIWDGADLLQVIQWIHL
jgi:hypothetical protein